MSNLFIEQIANLFRLEKTVRLMQWSLKAGIAILDQGLFSGSNFLLNILLARWLKPDDYGAFSLAFAIYLFFSGIHNALILEPVTVLGPANHAGHMPEYILVQVKLHFLITGLLGLFVVGGTGLSRFWLQNSALTVALIGVGIGLPFMLLSWLARRVCYLFQQPIYALLSSFVYAVVLLLGTALLGRKTGMENLLFWFGLMGVAGLCSAFTVILYIPSRNRPHATSLMWGDLLREQWGFGKWVMGAVVPYSIATQAQLFLTAGMIDLDSAGAWRALQNFTLPIMQGITALSVLGMPALAREFGIANFPSLRRKGVRLLGLMMLFAVFNEVALLLFGSSLGAWIYGGKYDQYFGLLPLLGIVPILAALATGYSLMLRAIQRPSYYFITNLTSAIISVTSGIWMTRHWGIVGATWSTVLTSFVSLGVNLILFRMWFTEAERKTASRIVLADITQQADHD